MALVRAGVPDDVAFAVAGRAVRSHVAAIAVGIATALPHCPQIVVIDEPWFGDLMEPGFPIAPDRAIDMLSSAMASVSGVATVGVHCCAEADIASLLAAGPDILSVPMHPRLAGVAGYIDRFVAAGGRVAWGVVPTDGPMFTSTERYWRELIELWDQLARRGADRDLLRAQSLVTPHCGLGSHTPIVAERVCRVTRAIGRRIDDSEPGDDQREPRTVPGHERVALAPGAATEAARRSLARIDDVTAASIPPSASSSWPRSSPTTTTATTRSTTPRYPTETSTCSCASCARSPPPTPRWSSTTRSRPTSAGHRARCSRLSCTPRR